MAPMNGFPQSDRPGPRPPRGQRLRKLLLAVGFLALVVAVLAAHEAPATGYELSIYGATPAAFWGGVALALALSLYLAWTGAASDRVRSGALLLASASVFSVVALPAIRGYYFVGAGDSLTHLGWLEEMAANTLQPVAFLYPGVHTVALFASQVLGVGFPKAIEYAVLAFVLVYLVFVPLCVRAIVGTDLALVVGTFSALLLLPVNNISVHLMAHPTTQAILFTPLVLFLALHYLTRNPSRATLTVTASGAMLAVATLAIVLVHPQTALNVLLLFGTVVVVQVVYRRFRPAHAVSRHRPLYAQTAVLTLAFAVWAPRNARVQGTVAGVLNNLLHGATPGAAIAEHGTSLLAVGGSLGGLFVKLFLVSAVFAAFAGLLMLAALAGRLDGRYPDRNALVTYLTAGMVPLLAAFLVFFLLSVETQPFRYSGFIMAVVTVLGAAALAIGLRSLSTRVSSTTLRAAVAVLFVLATPLAVATVFGSPFIYQPNAQVTEMQVTGYRTAFSHRADGVAFAGIRSGPERYLHAIYGTNRAEAMAFPGKTAAVPQRVFNTNLSSYYGGDRYLPVSQRDHQREVVLYRGFRYHAASFRALGGTPGIDRVESNGAFNLYYIDSGA